VPKTSVFGYIRHYRFVAHLRAALVERLRSIHDKVGALFCIRHLFARRVRVFAVWCGYLRTIIADR
jgi:hypothetical protein